MYLLGGAMQMDKIGLISTDLAEKLALAATEAPYCVTAEALSSACGQGISAGGVRDVMRRLGERASEGEEHAVRRMDAGQAAGKKEVPVLFGEMDCVWLNMQVEHHKKMEEQEMKVFTMYGGWDAGKEKQGRSTLVEKAMPAGMGKSREPHEKREACIRKKYDADEVGQRILNGDGGGWINGPYGPEAIFQLDRHQAYQEVMGKASGKKAQKEVRELYGPDNPEKMLEYTQAYAASVESPDGKDKGSQKALELCKCLDGNRGGSLPYGKRVIKIAAPPEGVIYKGMGVQESQDCTVATLRTENRGMHWPVKGANNLAKVLCRKENRELIGMIERYTDG